MRMVKGKIQPQTVQCQVCTQCIRRGPANLLAYIRGENSRYRAHHICPDIETGDKEQSAYYDSKPGGINEIAQYLWAEQLEGDTTQQQKRHLRNFEFLRREISCQ